MKFDKSDVSAFIFKATIFAWIKSEDESNP